jgi:hypothetical protein
MKKKINAILFDIVCYSLSVAAGIGLLYGGGFIVGTLFKYFGI